MASEETVILNDITALGLRRMHVARMGGRVGRERWIESVPEGGREFLQVWERQEKELDVWHLWLWWNAREVVTLTTDLGSGLNGLGKRLAGFWWLGGMPARLGIDCAATMFFLEVGRWPGVAVMQKLPRGAESTVRVEYGGSSMELPLRAEGWAPDKYVVVMEEKHG